MIAQDLVHRKLLFDSDLDFEDLNQVPELPGKQVMGDLLQVMAQKYDVGSKLIQDSHGWCFSIYESDARKYLLELIPVRTADGISEWVLHCSRCRGLRLWEIAKDDRKPLGLEQQCLDVAAEILISKYQFEKPASP
jgi:hypothetical protein